MQIAEMHPGGARQLEWLETNGLGGFASSTVAGMNTRRYHGLLVAALRPPAERFVLVSKMEETLVVNGARFELSVNQYPGAFHPSGDQFLSGFERNPLPTFTYRAGGVEVKKRLFLVHGENTLVLRYTMTPYEADGPAACELELRPLIAFRDHHATTHRNDALNTSVEQEAGMVRIQPYSDLPRISFRHNAVEISPTCDWYLNFEYERERERGLDFREDLFQPFVMRFDLKRRSTAFVVASIPPFDAPAGVRSGELADLERAESERRVALRTKPDLKAALIEALTAAADQFVVQRGGLKTVIAGYHWFGDWGRDTMIALPGLTLTTGRYSIARDILRAFALASDRGMLPNRFPEVGETPEYNTVDATLWFFEAARAYAAASGDDEFLTRDLLPVLRDIVDWHIKGTRYGIQVDSDGLLASGEPGVQLTWMDAKIGDWVVTPRTGKPVEIQALWYNALRIMESLTGESCYAEMAARAKQSFAAQFWNADAHCLFDVVRGDLRDSSMRPNQIFAASLHYPILEGERARQMLAAVERELLTPAGLRTLSPNDANYRGHYQGGVWERDSAYHQGTVWPWLAGPFFSAYLKYHADAGGARERLSQWLAAFERHFDVTRLGQIPELADGDAPHAPRGCITQAWSVAELLRIAVECSGAGY